MSGLSRVDTAALKQAVPLVDLVGSRVRLRQRKPAEWVGLCPFHQEKTPSFKVEGNRFFICHGCGTRGDHFSWLKLVLGLDFADAVRHLEDLRGGGSTRSAARPAPAPEPSADPTDDLARRARALAVWQEARPAADTPVVAYLASRGVRLPPPPSLRFHPGLWHPDARKALPAMVAAMVDVSRRVVAVHRTFLAPGGDGKAAVPRAKLMLGTAAGTAIRLAPVGESGVLGVAEGIETALSVMQMAPGLPVWAAGSLGGIAGSGLSSDQGRPHPTRPGLRLPGETPDLGRPGMVLPDYVRHVVILPDADGDRPMQAALIERAIRRWQRGGLRVSVSWPDAGSDFNDMLKEAAA